jgi:hypothetical protein
MSPTDPERRALLALFDLAEVQLGLLTDAAGRRDVSVEGLSRTALELLLTGLGAQARGLSSHPDLPADARARYQRFAEVVGAAAQSTVRVESHLLELSAGWRCPGCGSEVASAAAIVQEAGGAPRVQLRCGDCQQRSWAPEAGQQLFHQKFGHLVREGWDPTLHGFVAAKGG